MKHTKSTLFIAVTIAVAAVFGVFSLMGIGFRTPAPVSLDTPSATPSVQGDTPSLERLSAIDNQGASPSAVGTFLNDEIGDYVVGPEGRALYTTEKACDSSICLRVWPPYLVDTEVSDGDLGTVYREDLETFQYTWKGEALYWYAEDTRLGSAKGDGIGGVWSVARP